jgi:cysteinyl-tRNA synthetase
MSRGRRPAVSEVPEAIRRLAEERQAARAARNFALADALRERIRSAGFGVADAPGGPLVTPLPPEEDPPPAKRLRPSDVGSVLDQPPASEASVQWVVQGWPEDVIRGIESFRRYGPGRAVQHVVVDTVGMDPTSWPEGIDLVPLEPGVGWGAARNAGLLRAAGSIVLVVDGSLEVTGDVLGPLAGALADPTVGVTGPFGVITEDLHRFDASAGPEVDAVEGYLMAFRRELLEQGVRFDQKFRFYRTADIELSFQVKSMGLRATVTPVPVTKHEHRMWATTPEVERERLSKRNFYRFLDRWRGRMDLTVAGADAEPRTDDRRGDRPS